MMFDRLHHIGSNVSAILRRFPAPVALIFFVSVSAAPGTVSISAPSSSPTYTATSATVQLSGSFSGEISQINWDNVNTDDAGIASITDSQWSAGDIHLKPGTNEILVTGLQSGGTVVTDRIVIERSTNGPVIANIHANTETPRVNEKYELTFDVETAADYPLFMYDTQQPPNTHYQGVTVEGVITTPGGEIRTHPAFFNIETEQIDGLYVQTGRQDWKLRIAPLEPGVYQVSLRATDKNGTTTVPAGTFTAQVPVTHGFVRVSTSDPRYFEFTDGTLYWPFGMTWGVTGVVHGTNLDDTVLNYDRPWLGGRGIYTTRWARWLASNADWGNEGAEAPLNFTTSYPGHELSYDLAYPDRFRIWIANWADFDTPVYARLEPNTTYRVKVRLKTENLAGPRDASFPWGFVIRTSGFLSHVTSIEEAESALRNEPVMVDHITQNRDWHTLVVNFTTGNQISGSDFNLYLDNVTQGNVYIDEFSVKPVLSGGQLGGELIRFPRADMHTYVEQRPAAYTDDELTQAEHNQIYLRYVVHDKNDLIQNHLRVDGTFVAGSLDAGDGYYQPENSKATWLLKQWWRYLVARYGYSTAVFGWELNNEGPPDDGSGTHARTAQIFAAWMHKLDYDPHLATTSFWCCWEPTFWGDKVDFPDIDFADIHHYGEPTDMVEWYMEDARPAFQDHVGKPVVRGETGRVGQSNPIWYHNMLWSQLDYTAMFDIGYWFSEDVEAIDRDAQARILSDFLSTIPLNEGGYEDVAASVSSPQLQVLGQKNLSRGMAHFWVRNAGSSYTADTPPAQSGEISVKLHPSTAYCVEHFNTWALHDITTSTQSTDANGNLTIQIDALVRDTAFRVSPVNAPVKSAAECS